MSVREPLRIEDGQGGSNGSNSGSEGFVGGLIRGTQNAVDSATSGDFAGVGDALSGSTDESVGRIASGDRNVLVEVGQGFGRLDERQTQDLTGSREFDPSKIPILGGPIGVLGGGADAATGSVDEAIGRQFDKVEGGGAFDEGTGQAVVDDAVTRVTDTASAAVNEIPNEIKLAGGGIASAVLVLAVIYVVGQLFDVQVG